MYSVSQWDGLAKIGSFTTKHGIISTPALFPVVDPKQQSIPIQEFESRFGFSQVITSAYLMSKRLGHYNWNDYPKVHDYLPFDRTVMMDSGAYQVLLYGDIELGVETTLELQSTVEPDIGVIMDHPIGYDTSYTEAKQRLETTLQNIRHSIPLLSDNVTWTLPIQGGKYLNLLDHYLETVVTEELDHAFGMYALGSVVPVMINQDYSKLVEMILQARDKLPVSKPLHLFGAGHPAMFSLAVFLGCDTFDSAAYALMAKDNRYMTVRGTYHLQDLDELPCNCPVCSTNDGKSLRALNKQERITKISEHNLWVSKAEINQIKIAIKEGHLWDLVQERASSVPNLARATKQAMDLVSRGDTISKFISGTPVTKGKPVRITREADIKRPSVSSIIESTIPYFSSKNYTELHLLGFALDESVYNKYSDEMIGQQNIPDDVFVGFLVPTLGILPYGLNEIFPIGQMQVEIDPVVPSLLKIIESQITDLRLERVVLYVEEEWNNDVTEGLESVFPRLIIKQSSPSLKALIEEINK